MRPAALSRSLALAGPLLLTLFASLAVPSPAQGRSLHWRLLDAAAHLEADGALRVTERHTMVFDGAWNGGERIFRLEPGQEIELLEVSRIDPETGWRRRVLPGDLGRVDRYAWADGTSLRWRSRLPSDPPFEEEAITYVLDYRLMGALRPLGDDIYLLDHDFAFPDRAGVIERFRLELELDPAFEPLGPVPTDLEILGLVPGEGVVRTVRLRHAGEGRPEAALPPPPPLPFRLAAFLAAAAAMAWMLVRFRRRETALGRRWGRLPQTTGIDRAALDRTWIEETLLRLRPEVAGAFWDRSVGRAEVSALLARLVAEGKLESEVEETRSGFLGTTQELRLRLRVPREDFSGYERALVDKLFFGGRDEVTTSDLETRYRSTGLDPAGVIRPGLERRLRETLPAARTSKRRPSRLPAAALTLATLLLLGLEGGFRRDASEGVLAALVALGPLPYLVALGLAWSARRRVERLGAGAVAFAVPVAVTFAGAALYAFMPELRPGLLPTLAPGVFGVLALALAPVAAWRSVTHVAMTREGAPAIAARQELLRARRHLQAELERERPDLDDDWFPYLLALGLAQAVDRWSRSFGGTTAAGATVAAAAAPSGSAASRGSSVGGWTGGGGRFGGAGASATWAAAASGIASGVSSASSSGGSGGGGGGGGGSSGGGGGGGW